MQQSIILLTADKRPVADFRQAHALRNDIIHVEEAVENIIVYV